MTEETASARPIRTVAPDDVAPPLGPYSHAVVVPAGAEWLVVSGQIGVDGSGEIVDGIEAQSQAAFRNLHRIVSASGFSFGDIVSTRTYLTSVEDIPVFREVRDHIFAEFLPAGPYPTSTMVVARLANDRFLVEIEAVAARVPDLNPAPRGDVSTK